MAFNNNYSAIIQNPQATVNTTIQSSQLSGGNLAQLFNLQAMRMVKGQAYVNNSSNALFAATGAISNVLFNEYDGNPVTLGPSDFIVAYAVANGNSPLTGSAGPIFVPTQFTGTGTLDIQLASVPTYSTQTNSWTPGVSSGISICSTGPLNPNVLYTAGAYPTGFTVGQITTACTGINRNYGLLLPVTTAVGAVGANKWINVIGGGGFTTGGYVNVTLLVLSGFPAI
jgi:hypothetical protein